MRDAADAVRPGKSAHFPGPMSRWLRLARRLEVLECGPQPGGLIGAADLEPLGPLRPPGDPFVLPRQLAVALSGGRREEALLSVSC